MAERWVPQTVRDHLMMTVMESVRSFSDAMGHMHGGLRGDMGMNATDLAALRMLIIREREGVAVTPQDMARHLRISTASTSALLDRLSASGHLERRPHPADRRARVVVLADKARADFHRHFGARMARMRAAMDAYSDEDLRRIVEFLGDASHALLPDAVD